MSHGQTERQRLAELDRQRLRRKVEFLEARLAELVSAVDRLNERIDRVVELARLERRR